MVPVLISVVFPLPVGQGTPVFFLKHYKGHGFQREHIRAYLHTWPSKGVHGALTEEKCRDSEIY